MDRHLRQPTVPLRAYSMPIGATPMADGATLFRVWAPQRQEVAVEVRTSGGVHRRHAMGREEGGYFVTSVPELQPGDRYQFVLDQHLMRPDPASRRQPDGPHGWSEMIDPSQFVWNDATWRGVAKTDLVIYELHVGTFTDEGTFQAVQQRLDELVELGVTAVELMPVAQTPGRWNWGYDGVHLFAPRNTYGTPDQLRALVDACHRRGLAVLLDVVYNHVGPEGNYLGDYGPYFSKKHHTPWGPAFNFDGHQSRAVRDFILHNVLYWLHEFHLDGLRLDAVHFMYDESSLNILDEIAQHVDAVRSQLGRIVHLIGETNVHDPRLITRQPTTHASYDAIWCDDFLHAVQSVAMHERRLTRRVYHGAEDLAAVLQHGYLYQSPSYARVVHPLNQPPESTGSLVFSLQNHDVIGNHPDGDRLHQLVSPEFQRAAAALLLLYPAIPMVFMGEEFSAEAKFLFFVDFGDHRLRRAVVQGRAAEHPQHRWQEGVSPISEKAFVLSRPGPREAGNEVTWKWYRNLLELRHRWRQAGLLREENLRVDYHAATQLIVLRYAHDHQHAFVAVRLFGQGEAPAPLHVTINGQLLMASEGVEELVAAAQPPHAMTLPAAADHEPKTLRLLLNRAIIGYGELVPVV